MPWLHVARNRGETGFAEHQVHGMQLMAAVAAVLLVLVGHAVHQGLLRGVMERVDRGVEEALERGLGAANMGLLRPGKLTTAARRRRGS